MRARGAGMFNFEELNERTRESMLREIEAEMDGGNPFRPSRLSLAGWDAFRDRLRDAVREQDEEWLAAEISTPGYWKQYGTRLVAGKDVRPKVNPFYHAKMLACSEFNTWYVRGLARLLMNEGVDFCEVYRAAPAMEPRPECAKHENAHYPVRDVYNGHRARYHPVNNPRAFSIPVGPNCHHAIRRCR